MLKKTIYPKEIIIPRTTVAGNIRDFKQQYEGFYYPQADDLPSKIALYIYLVGKDNKDKAPRSLFFSSTEQLKQLIFDLTRAYFYFLDKRNKPVQRDIWRKANVDNFAYDLRRKQLAIWSKQEPKKTIHRF